MHFFIAKQLEILHQIQQFQYPHFIGVNTFFSSLQGIVAVILLTSIYWVINRKVGMRVLVLYLLAAILVWALKGAVQLPRPFVFDPSLKLTGATGFSFPSGDACAATVVYGALAHYFKRKIGYFVAVVLIVLIAYSRLALGVHFPSDVIAGIILGLIILTLYFKIIEPKWLNIKINRWVCVPLVGILLYCISLFFTLSTPIIAAGILSGLVAGLLFPVKQEKYPTTTSSKIAYAFIGFIILCLLFYYLRLDVFSFLLSKNNLIYIKAFLVGFWVPFYGWLLTAGLIVKTR